MIKVCIVMGTSMSGILSKFTLLFVLTLISCGRKSSYPSPEQHVETSADGRPPAYVQKAWDARYSYDADRRLLVPEYAGSRWGAIQQYKEEGELVYQDWWIRDVRSEDLEASPDTAITSFLDDDGNLTVVSQNEEDPFGSVDSSNDGSKNSSDSDITEDEFSLPPGGEESPFVPSPFSPF